MTRIEVALRRAHGMFNICENNARRLNLDFVRRKKLLKNAQLNVTKPAELAASSVSMLTRHVHEIDFPALVSRPLIIILAFFSSISSKKSN